MNLPTVRVVKYKEENAFKQVMSAVQRRRYVLEECWQCRGNAGSTKEFRKAEKITSSFVTRVLFALQDKQALHLGEGLELFNILDRNGSKSLTKKEIRNPLARKKDGTERNGYNPEAVKFIEKYHKTPFDMLLDRTKVTEFFKALDVDGDGVVTAEEWQGFLARLILRDVEYLVESGWVFKYSHWARSVGKNVHFEEELGFSRDAFSFREWWADLV